MAENSDELNSLLARLYKPGNGAGDELSMLRSDFEAQLGGTEANVKATESASAVESTAGNGGSAWDGAISPILRTVLGGMPLVSGLVSLFSGGDSSPAADPPTRYTPPPSIHVNAGLFQDGSKIDAVDYSQDGSVRTVGAPTAGSVGMSSVVVQVQAMDSQSFLDRSDDIADAVRKALLNSHPLGDVIN
jgi:hypothetical protein